MATDVAKVFSKRKHKLPELCNEFVIPDAKIGIEVELERAQRATNPESTGWQVKPDHSLRDGLEFTTDGGLVGKELSTAIEKLCAYAMAHKLSEGLPRASIHIHMDVTDLNGKHDRELLNFMGCCILCEHLLFGFAGDWRAYTGYCDPLNFSKDDYKALSVILTRWGEMTPQTIREYWRGAPNDGQYLSKYQAVNLLPMQTFGTIEFRHLPTTFDPARIKLWINLLLCIKRWAINSPHYMNLEIMFSRLGVERFYQSVFGDLFPHVREFMSENKAWQAVDNYQSLVYPGAKELFFDPPVNAKYKLVSGIEEKQIRKEKVAQDNQNAPAALEEAPRVPDPFAQAALEAVVLAERQRARIARAFAEDRPPDAAPQDPPGQRAGRNPPRFRRT